MRTALVITNVLNTDTTQSVVPVVVLVVAAVVVVVGVDKTCVSVDC